MAVIKDFIENKTLDELMTMLVSCGVTLESCKNDKERLAQANDWIEAIKFEISNRICGL